MQRENALPDQVIPFPFGVNIHFVEPRQRELDLIHSAGFRFIRMDVTWSTVERRRGEYDLSGYDMLMEALESRDIRPLFILDYGNPLYDDGLAPHTDRGRAAFAEFAYRAAARFRGRGILWEIWNEPNIHFWKPQPNVDDYAKLAVETAESIRQADPDAIVVAPATSGIDLVFVEECFQRGLLEHIDVVSVHPYREAPPETVSSEYSRLRQLVDAYAPAGKTVPLISGEWGYTTTKVSLEQQAMYLVRQFLTNMLIGFKLSIWYDWRDDGTDPKEPEHHFGTVGFGLDPKPAYLAVKTLVNQLYGYRLVGRLHVGGEEDYVLLFERRGSRKIAAWTTAEDHYVDLPEGYALSDSVDMVGNSIRRNSRRKIRLSSSPTYASAP